MSHGVVSLFPHLFDYQFLAIGALRIAAGAISVLAGYRHLAEKKHILEAGARKRVRTMVGGLLIIAGLLLIIGLYTQAAAIMGAAMWLGAAIVSLKRRESFLRFAATYSFIALVCLSFLFLGPGTFAIDLPL